MTRWSILVVFVILASLIVGCAAPPPAAVAPTAQVVEKQVVVEKPVVQTVVVEKQVNVEKPVVQTVEVPVSNIPQGAKLNVWGYQSFVEGADDLFRGQVKDWSNMTGVPVEVTMINGDDMAAKYTAALEAPDTLPDILVMDSPFFPMFQEAGKLQDVSDVVSDLNKQQGGILPGALAGVTVNGKQYAMPYLGDVMITYLRKDVFEKAGIPLPTTYDELLKACPKILKPGEMYCWGLDMNGYGDPEFALRGLIWSFGGRITDETGKKSTFSSPETLEAFKYIKSMIDAGGFPPDATTADDSGNNLWWQKRLTAFTQNSPSIFSWVQTNDKARAGDTVIAAPMKGPKGQYMPVNTFTMAATTNSKYPDLAKKLFGYLAAPEREFSYIEAANYPQLPVYKNLLNRPPYSNDPLMKAEADTMASSVVQSWPGPPTSASTELNTQRVLSKAVISMVTDKVTPEQAMANADKQIQEILARHAQ